MTKKILISTFLTILICGTLTVKPVEAKCLGWGGFWGFSNNLDDWAERMEKMFENWANLLQISVEKIKNYWAEGKTMKEIMEAENISQEDVQKRINEKRLEGLKDQLQKLVEKGIITQEQANKRFEIMKNWLENKVGKRMFKGNWHWGWPMR